MTDAIDELLIEWWDYEAEYRPKLDYDRVDPACRDYRARWQDGEDLAERAEAAARRAIAEAVSACVQRIDLRLRIAVNTMLRNWCSGANVWQSIRLAEDPEAIYPEAKRALAPLFVNCGLLDRSELPRFANLTENA